MDKYDEIVRDFPSELCNNVRLTKVVNDTFLVKIQQLLFTANCKVEGKLSLHQDLNLPHLWHIYEEKQGRTIPLDFLFQGKTETIINKYEEVSNYGNFCHSKSKRWCG